MYKIHINEDGTTSVYSTETGRLTYVVPKRNLSADENSSPENPQKSYTTTRKRNKSFSPQSRPIGIQSHEVVRCQSSNDSIDKGAESSFDIPFQQTIITPRGRPKKRKSSETTLLEKRQYIKSTDENSPPGKLQRKIETDDKRNEIICPEPGPSGTRILPVESGKESLINIHKGSKVSDIPAHKKVLQKRPVCHGRPSETIPSKIRILKVVNGEEFPCDNYGGTESSCNAPPQKKRIQQRKDSAPLAARSPKYKKNFLKKTKCFKSTEDGSSAGEFQKSNETIDRINGTISPQPGPSGIQNIKNVTEKESSIGNICGGTKISNDAPALQRKQNKKSALRGRSRYKMPRAKPLLDKPQYTISRMTRQDKLKRRSKKIPNAYDDIEPEIGDSSLTKSPSDTDNVQDPYLFEIYDGITGKLLERIVNSKKSNRKRKSGKLKEKAETTEIISAQPERSIQILRVEESSDELITQQEKQRKGAALHGKTPKSKKLLGKTSYRKSINITSKEPQKSNKTTDRSNETIFSQPGPSGIPKHEIIRSQSSSGIIDNGTELSVDMPSHQIKQRKKSASHDRSTDPKPSGARDLPVVDRKASSHSKPAQQKKTGPKSTVANYDKLKRRKKKNLNAYDDIEPEIVSIRSVTGPQTYKVTDALVDMDIYDGVTGKLIEKCVKSKKLCMVRKSGKLKENAETIERQNEMVSPQPGPSGIQIPQVVDGKESSNDNIYGETEPFDGTPAELRKQKDGSNPRGRPIEPIPSNIQILKVVDGIESSADNIYGRTESSHDTPVQQKKQIKGSSAPRGRSPKHKKLFKKKKYPKSKGKCLRQKVLRKSNETTDDSSEMISPQPKPSEIKNLQVAIQKESSNDNMHGAVKISDDTSFEQKKASSTHGRLLKCKMPGTKLSVKRKYPKSPEKCSPQGEVKKNNETTDKSDEIISSQPEPSELKKLVVAIQKESSIDKMHGAVEFSDDTSFEKKCKKKASPRGRPLKRKMPGTRLLVKRKYLKSSVSLF